LHHLLPILAVHGTGQSLTVYNNIITKPSINEKSGGPEQIYFILLDNGRSQLYNFTPQFEALTCIRCGACLNVCPIYYNVGGYTYNCTYTGPIGSVISPFYNGFKDFGHLSFASSLCGRCTEICPAKIKLHELLLENRNLYIKSRTPGVKERIIAKSFSLANLRNFFYRFRNLNLENYLLNSIVQKLWGRRKFPALNNSFRNQFKVKPDKDAKYNL
jgi:L-lactate dehydrogenase complex protein LldF